MDNTQRKYILSRLDHIYHSKREVIQLEGRRAEKQEKLGWLQRIKEGTAGPFVIPEGHELIYGRDFYLFDFYPELVKDSTERDKRLQTLQDEVTALKDEIILGGAATEILEKLRALQEKEF